MDGGEEALQVGGALRCPRDAVDRGLQLFGPLVLRDVAREAPRVDELAVLPPHVRVDEDVFEAAVLAAQPGRVAGEGLVALQPV